MILIVTNRSDQTADWLILELRRRRASYARFNTEDYPAHVRLRWSLNGEATLAWADKHIRLRDVTAVWYRRPLPPASLAMWSSPERARWALGEAREALDGLWRTLDVFWINHPDSNRAAGFKLHQLKLASHLGFSVPPTVVSNDASEVRRFAATSQPRGIVCKPIGEGRLRLTDQEQLFFTSRMQLVNEDPLNDLGPEPYLFQEFIPKRYDVRVTVIGRKVFATKIDSQATVTGKTDWRVAGSDAPHVPEELPAGVVECCLQITRSYGLEFAAIDLARNKNGGYTFFEINPNGQWAWIEQLTGQPLRSHMADLLQGTRR
jgi:glutathione synthase/RimK-type ligase-like ATP-grasp enzyme